MSDEREIKRLACFTVDSIAANGYSKYGQPSVTDIYNIVHHALRMAAGYEKMVDWKDPYDAKMGWKPPEPIIERLKKELAKDGA